MYCQCKVQERIGRYTTQVRLKGKSTKQFNCGKCGREIATEQMKREFGWIDLEKFKNMYGLAREVPEAEERYTAALVRHLLSETDGEIDEERGVHPVQGHIGVPVLPFRPAAAE